MKKYVSIFTLFIFPLALGAQLRIDMTGMNSQLIDRAAIVIGEEATSRDSVYSKGLDRSKILNIPSVAHGLYRLTFLYQNMPVAEVPFASTNRPVTLTITDGQDGELAFKWSDQINSKMYLFNEQAEKILSDISGFTPLLKQYPYKETDFYSVLKAEKDSYLKRYDQHYDSLRYFPDKKIAAAIRAQKAVIPPTDLAESEYLNFIREHFFDNFSFKDPMLQDQLVYDQKMKTYLGFILYSENPDGLTLQQDLAKFISTQLPVGVPRYADDLKNIDMALRQLGYDNEANYIDSVFRAKIPGAENDAQLKKRLEAYKRLAVGKIAPDFTWTDQKGEHSLHSIAADLMVLAFWASWCQDCQRELPAVTAIENAYPDLVFLGVGLDNDVNEWNKAKALHPKWIHTMAQGMWDNPTAELYNISAMPVFYLLDKDKKILGTASSAHALEVLLKETEGK